MCGNNTDVYSCDFQQAQLSVKSDRWYTNAEEIIIGNKNARENNFFVARRHHAENWVWAEQQGRDAKKESQS